MTSDSTFHPSHPHKSTSVVKLVLAVFIVGLAIATTILGYLYYTTHTRLTQLSTPEGQEELAKQEVALTLSRLQKLTIIPEEDPVVATIIDASLLASQSAFYRDAQNGDQLVVFPQAQKAYIFSPSRNIVVNAGPLIIDNGGGTTSTQDSPSAPERLTVEVRNGSTTPGKGTQIGQQLDQSVFSVTTVAQAQHTEYGQTVVIGLTEAANADVLSVLATQLNATTQTTLPAGEAPSQADLVIIVGNNS